MTENKVDVKNEPQQKEVPEVPEAHEVSSLPQNPQLNQINNNDSKFNTYKSNKPTYSPNQQRQQPLTQALKNALYSAKDRMFILTLEQDLISFISSNTDSYLLRPMNSYYRLLTHQTAEYYNLGHSLHNDGSSILVFKNFGVEINPTRSLASIPYDYSIPLPDLHPQFHAAHLQHHQGFIPNHNNPAAAAVGSPNAAGAPGAPPFGYMPQGPPPPPGYPQFQPPMPRSPYTQFHPVSVGSSVSQSQETKSPISVMSTPNDGGKKEFKLMRRKGDDDDEKNDKKDEAKQDGKVKDESATATAPETEDPVKLESERASRESIYQKARERIFQAEEDEDEEEDEDYEDKKQPQGYGSSQNNNTSPDIPRIIPQPYQSHTQSSILQHHQPYQQIPIQQQLHQQDQSQAQVQQQFSQYGYPQSGLPPFPISQTGPYYYPISYPPGVIPPQGLSQYPSSSGTNPSSANGTTDAGNSGYYPNQFYYTQSPQQHHNNSNSSGQGFRRHRGGYNPNHKKNYNYNNNNNNNHGYNNYQQGGYSKGYNNNNYQNYNNRDYNSSSSYINEKFDKKTNEETRNNNNDDGKDLSEDLIDKLRIDDKTQEKDVKNSDE